MLKWCHFAIENKNFAFCDKILSFLFVILKIMYIFVLLLNDDVSLIKIYDYGTRIIFFGSVDVFSSKNLC